jgi:uncharacterized protein
VSDLRREPGRRRAESISAPVAWGIELSRTDLERPVSAEIRLEGISGGIYVTGSIEAEVEHTCHRCTRTWSETILVEVGELIGAQDETDYGLDGEVADLEPVLRDALVLAFPLTPTCSSDCLGLCALCGGDLNTGACPGHDEEPESPFASLRDIFEP